MAYSNDDIVKDAGDICDIMHAQKTIRQKARNVPIDDEMDDMGVINPSRIDYCRVMLFVCCVLVAVCSLMYFAYIAATHSIWQSEIENFLMKNLFSSYFPKDPDTNFVISITLKNTKDASDKISMNGNQILIPIPRDIFRDGIPRLEMSTSSQGTPEL